MLFYDIKKEKKRSMKKKSEIRDSCSFNTPKLNSEVIIIINNYNGHCLHIRKQLIVLPLTLTGQDC